MRAKISKTNCGYPMLRLGLLCLIMRVGLASVTCQTQCADGEYCTGSDCKDCEKGTYISDTLHEYTSCIPWTDKPTGENWMIKTEGTSHSDREWACEPGYHVIKISVGQEECLPEENQASSVAWEFTMESSIPTTMGVNKEPTDEALSGGTIAGIVLGVVVVLLLLVVIIILCKMQKLPSTAHCCACCSRDIERAVTDPSSGNEETNGHLLLSENTCAEDIQITSSSRDSLEKEEINGLVNSSEVPHACKSHDLQMFSRYLFNQLGKNSFSFLKCLKNESKDLNIDSSLHFHKTDDVITGYVTVFSEWVEKNPNLSHLKCVTDALIQIQTEQVLHYEEFKNLSRTVFPQEHLDEVMHFEGGPKSPLMDQSFYKVAIFVVRELGKDCKDLLLLLKCDNKQFNMKSVLHFQLEEHTNDYIAACADAMIDWRNANPSMPHLQCIESALNEINRNEIIQHDQFKMLTETFCRDSKS